MISKELLSEVLKNNEIAIDFISTSNVYYYHSLRNKHMGFKSSINIYELAYKCKEWAFTEGYEIHSFKRANMCYRAYPTKTGRGGSNFEGEDTSEPEATFKACQWILDNKDNK